MLTKTKMERSALKKSAPFFVAKKYLKDIMRAQILKI